MYRQILMVALAGSCVLAQQAQAPASDAERVVARLRTGDPLVDGKIGSELLGAGSLDDAIRAVARSEATEPVVRLRALRLVRSLDLAARVRGPGRRDLPWWLALHEIRFDGPEAVAPCLLKRAFAEEGACAAAVKELDAASEVANRFCIEWNEIRTAKDAAKYDALEAELKGAAPAAVPALLGILTLPPEAAFTVMKDGQPISARQQVRAILALAAVLELEQALPYFVAHSSGPSLTQRSHAGMAVQRFSGEKLGAAFLVEGDEAAILAWWQKHKLEHRVVLDHVVHGTSRWARAALDQRDPRATEGAWCAVRFLHRALGEDREAPHHADAEGLRTRLDEIESAWLLAPR